MTDADPHVTEFVCEDCGGNVMAFGYHDKFPVCTICRFIREHPDLPPDVIDALRGDD